MSLDRAVEQSLESFWGHYEAGDLNEALQVYSQFGFDEDVTAFTYNPDSYYIPNRRGNQFVTPRGTPRDAIPVLGVETSAEHIFERPALHHLQRIALRRCGINSTRQIEAAFSRGSNQVTSSGGSPGSASILSRPVAIETAGVAVRDKPVIMLNITHNGVDHQPICPGAFLHETVHVAQFLDDPIYHPEDQLRLELEAYGVEARLASLACRVPYSKAIAMAAEVNSFRAKNLGPNNYTPTPAFEEAFRSPEHLARLLPPKR